jgi:hypothetical protein
MFGVCEHDNLSYWMEHIVLQIGHVEIKGDPSEARSWINNILGRVGMGIPMDPVWIYEEIMLFPSSDAF